MGKPPCYTKEKMQEEISMYHFDLPYGKGSLSLDLPKNRVSGVLTSGLDHYTPEFSPEELVDRALDRRNQKHTLQTMRNKRKK